LGFWKALWKVYGPVPQQCGLVNKTANVLNKFTKVIQKQANLRLQQIWKQHAKEAFGFFRSPKEPSIHAWTKTATTTPGFLR
jgi:hypothetical protein